MKISNEEWQEISLQLENHHAVFYKLWQMGRPNFTEDIDTAAVQFDETGEFVWFHFNPIFWERLSFYGKLFVICHEALHIILNHGLRISNAGINRKACNSALDIVVNSLLATNMGFSRSKIDEEIKPIFKLMAEEEAVKNGKEFKWTPEQEKYHGLCWVDTVFRDRKPTPKDGEMFEYYYNLFEKVYGDGGAGENEGDGPSTLDDHSHMSDKSDSWDKAIDSLNKELSEDEKSSLKSTINKHFQKPKNQPAGKGTGTWHFVDTKKVEKKKKWETIIKKWSIKYYKTKDINKEQWVLLNRRLHMLPRNMFLPSNAEIVEHEAIKDRIKVYFFLDTSGSCIGLKDRFFAAAKSLPPEKFEIRLLCFDVKVVETTLESGKVYGGGGTSFSILEEFIQKEVNQGEPYPLGVFVITDGEANPIKPEFPENWYWFLTPGGTKRYIDKNCNFFSLQDFE